MDGTRTRFAHKKTHNVFGRLKDALMRRNRDKNTPLSTPDPSASGPTTTPYANSGLVPGADIPNTDDTDNTDTRDRWQTAYEALNERDRNTLAILLPATETEPHDTGRARARDILDQVIKATETQYKENPRKGDIRAIAYRILNSALSFQDVVNNAVKFDPIGYASSAWAIVSLGLTMAKNYADFRGALFDSSGYLADLLTRCAFIEEQFYRGSGPDVANIEKERSIVRVYVAILQYSAEVRRAQQFGKGKDLMESITATISQQLAQLKALVKDEESHLHHWLILDQHLHRKKETEAILTQIDQLLMDMKKVHEVVAMLNLPVADGAFFDSFLDQHEDECLPGTRTDLLWQVQEWERLSDRCIFWLSGMAGTGKSTIARTVARSFREDGILGASFFFKRGEGDRGSAARFFPTIVKQLAVHIPQMISGVQRAIEKDPAIPGKSLREQFDKLLLQPLLAVDQDQPSTSTVVVIDALDECDREEDVEVILQLLPKVEKATCLKIRIFLTSRPESPIRFGFDQINQNDYQNTILQNLDGDVIKHDITLYLTEEFRKIRQRRQRDLPHDWPGEARIEGLAVIAAPLFIFAATVCRFVADKRWNPERRLQQFFDSSSGSKMDKTYQPILNQLLAGDESDTDQLVEEFQRTIGVIILLATPLSLSTLAELVEMSEDDIGTRLDAFHSVLTMPGDPNLPIRTLHLSFHDYLVDKRTKAQESTSRFWVDKQKKHEFIAGQCLIVMRRLLRKNICNLPSFGTSRSEMDTASTARFLSPALLYACRSWVYHLAQSSLSAKTIDQIHPFLEEHFLHWLEVMAISGIIFECLNTINILLELTNKAPYNTVSLFLLDARRFILKFMNIVDTAPLQLYSSGLIFAPQNSLIRRYFEKELPGWLSRGPRVEWNWSPELQTLEGHSEPVESVSFSPDGRLLASGSEDQAITLWDVGTGNIMSSIEGHSGSVLSVAFSPDGRLLASGSKDQTIKLWNPTTGNLKYTLEGHSKPVQSVAFSPDGQLLASASQDRTIKIWNPATGNIKYTLQGHSGWVWSVAFSSDSQILVSGSSDGTIKLWNPTTGAFQHTLEGHSDSVRSVALSVDGRLLASGSEDRTIKLWDLATGSPKNTLKCHSYSYQLVAFPPDARLLVSGSGDRTINVWDPDTSNIKYTLAHHSGSVRSVAFSPNGRLLASGSGDRTIKLWELTTSDPEETLESHSDSVLSVSFSPCGQLLASGSGDRTVKLWDANTGNVKHTLKGHSGSIWSVAFSPNGQFLASGSSDRTIKLWDPDTGSIRHTLEDHSGSIWSVAFSPDSQLLASGSSDQTIKLWDPDTGNAKHTIHTDERITRVEFSTELPHLITNIGCFDIDPWYKGFSPSTSKLSIKVSLQAARWVTVQGQREIWLPPEYHPSSSATINGTLGVGSRTGRVCLLKFSV